MDRCCLWLLSSFGVKVPAGASNQISAHYSEITSCAARTSVSFSRYRLVAPCMKSWQSLSLLDRSIRGVAKNSGQRSTKIRTSGGARQVQVHHPISLSANYSHIIVIKILQCAGVMFLLEDNTGA